MSICENLWIVSDFCLAQRAQRTQSAPGTTMRGEKWQGGHGTGAMRPATHRPAFSLRPLRLCEQYCLAGVPANLPTVVFFDKCGKING